MSEAQGCLLIHGFAGNTDEIAPVARELEGQGFVTVCPPLEGHSGRRADLARTDHRDWLSSAEKALVKLRKECGKVVVIGFSMGGLIAANLAQTHPVDAVVLLSTPYWVLDPKRFLRNLAADLRAKKRLSLRETLRQAWSVSLKSARDFLRFNAATRPLFGRIPCPVFIGQGEQDETVQSRSARRIFEQVAHGRKSLKFYPGSRHQIFRGRDREEIIRDVLRFVQEIG